MVIKNMLIKAAKQAQEEKANVWLLYDEGFKVIIDNSKCSDDFFKKYNYSYKDLLQVFMPDMILKHDYANYNYATMSINTFLDKINNKYCNINCDE
jgi:hypothetical protein